MISWNIEKSVFYGGAAEMYFWGLDFEWIYVKSGIMHT